MSADLASDERVSKELADSVLRPAFARAWLCMHNITCSSSAGVWLVFVCLSPPQPVLGASRWS